MMRERARQAAGLSEDEMSTWTIGDTTFIGNTDLSGDIEILRSLSRNDHVLTIKFPGRHFAIFMRNRLVDAVNQQFDLADEPGARQAAGLSEEMINQDVAEERARCAAMARHIVEHSKDPKVRVTARVILARIEQGLTEADLTAETVEDIDGAVYRTSDLPK
jgi:hypothetical protein